jgi:hypothetical protein
MDKTNWVIVYTAGGNFIGKNIGTGDKVVLDPAFIWINEQVMVGPGQMGTVRQPAPLADHPDACKLEIANYSAMQQIDEYPEAVCDDLLKTAEQVLENIKSAAAKKYSKIQVVEKPRIIL